MTAAHATTALTADEHWIRQLATTNRYLGERSAGPGEFACVMPLMFTGAIIKGTVGSELGYDNRWCYHSVDVAIAALDEWERRGFEGEPLGWHRHPDSGRRRTNGNPSTEYINR